MSILHVNKSQFQKKIIGGYFLTLQLSSHFTMSRSIAEKQESTIHLQIIVRPIIESVV